MNLTNIVNFQPDESIQRGGNILARLPSRMQKGYEKIATFNQYLALSRK